MAITELNTSRGLQVEGASETETRIFMVTGAAIDDISTVGPADLGANKVRRGATRKMVEGFAGELAEVTVTYGPPDDPAVEPTENESTYSFEAGQETRVIKQSYGTRTYVAPGKTAVNYYGGIAYNAESGEFDGAETTVPTFNFAETHYRPSSFGSITDIANIYAVVGKTNNATWKGFAPYEVMFIGASGSKRGGGLWEITYRFAASGNLDNVIVGDINIVLKRGWEHLHVMYEPDNDGNPKPAAAYLETVAKSTSFATLGIGV